MSESTPGPGSQREPRGPRSSFDRVFDAVERLGLSTRSRRRDDAMVRCPVHDEKTASLHISWHAGGRGAGGFVLMHCFGCQAAAEDLVAPLGLTLADLFDEPLPDRDRGFKRVGKSPQRRRAAQRRGRLGRLPALIARPAESVSEPDHAWVEVDRYPYVDLAGRLVQEVIREECSAGGEQRHKRFRQLFLTADGRRVKRRPEGFRPVLYRAPRVADAVRAGTPVWLVEGEKDVHSAERLGVVATTNTQGGRSFPDELAAGLKDAHVVAVLDRDATGWARGVDLHAKLSKAGAATVRLKLPAVDAAKADLTDHVEAGHGLDQLVDVAVQEVATWHALTAVQDKAKLLDQAVSEAQARLELAEAGQDVEENRRFAKRWALESQIRQEALRDLVDQVYGYGVRVGTIWAGQAMALADEMLVAATEQARRCHHAVGAPVPESLRPAPAPAVPAAAAEAEEAPSSDAAPQQTAAPNPSTGTAAASGPAAASGDDGWDPEQGVGAVAPVFRVLGGQIVQWEPDRSSRQRRDGGDEAGEEPGKFKVLLSTVVRVTVREYLEAEEDHDVAQVELMGRASSGRKRVSAPRSLAAVRLQFPDPVTGELMEIRVMADQWRDHSWLESLPGPVDYDHKRVGLDTLQRAILAVSGNVVDEVLYRSTGWRTCPDGTYRFIHARGAITAAGHDDAEVAFTGPIERYDLPDPVRDAAALRDAWWQTSATMLDRMPARVAAPLLGQVFRAVLGHNPWVLTLVGPPGSYKTSLAAKAMHHFGERWEHNRPASSMSGNGDTLNALRFKLHNAKDALYWLDDFAPTRSWLEAQRHLEETARLIHNQEERSRSARDGLSISDGTGPRASGLCTSEVMPRPGSGAERMLVVPLAREDLDTAQLFPLDDLASRHGRALVMASFISWLADGLKDKRRHYLQIADAYADALTETAGETVRQAAAISHAWIGWVAITDFLHAAGAVTSDEREQTLRRVDAALRAAGRAAVNPDMPRTTGARVRELLGYALRQGIAYVDDVRSGHDPPWPIAGRLGWRRTITEVDGSGLPVRTRYERMGIRLGFVLHDPDTRERGRVLMCESTQLEAVLKAASATQAEKLEIDRNTACRALLDEGVLIPDESEGRTRFTTKCKLYCEGRTARMVTLRLDEIIGGGEDGDATDPYTDDPDGWNDWGGGSSSDPPPVTAPDDASDDAATDEQVDGPADAGPAEVPAALIPGLALATDTVDAAEVSVPSDTVVVTHHDDLDGSDQPCEETTMPSAATRWTDRKGVVWRIGGDGDAGGPCAVCGMRCIVEIDCVRVHPLCWTEPTEPQLTEAQPAEAEPTEAKPTEAEPAAATPKHAAGTPAATPTQPTTPTRRASPPTAAPTRPSERQQRARTTTTRTGAQPSAGFRAAAAVVDLDGIWCSNGDHLPMPGMPKHVGDLVRLAQEQRLGTQVTKYLTAGAQIWVGEGLAREMGIDVERIARASDDDRDKIARQVTKDTAAVTVALADGYSIGGRDGNNLGRWTRVWKGSEKSVWIVLLPAMPSDGASVALMRDAPDHATLARRIGLLADALGHPYQLSGSTTGLDLMIALRWKDREQLFAAREPVPPALMNVEADISWCRAPTAEEAAHEWVHAYDRSGSYLAGVSGLELGVGDPIHHPDGAAFTAKQPGYWRIEVPAGGDWRMPHPLDPRGTNAGKVRWLTTPGLEFALEQGYEPRILEAYIWPERARILDPWYERIRDARTRLDVDDVDAQVARDQLKQIYAPTIGMLGSQIHMSGRRGYSPERRHHIVAKARTNILRRVAKIGAETGRWPVAVVADTVLYTSTEADPVAAWPGEAKWLGRELGRYKVEGSARLADQLSYLTGGTYKGKDAMVGRQAGRE